MFNKLKMQLAQGKKEWDNVDGYVQPIIPYWAYLILAYGASIGVLGTLAYVVGSKVL
jgi:hypothetical protein